VALRLGVTEEEEEEEDVAAKELFMPWGSYDLIRLCRCSVEEKTTSATSVIFFCSW